MIVGAASGIGIRPYDDGGMRRLDLAPRALRQRGLAARLGASDRGDLAAPPYRDWERDGIRIRNEDAVVAYSRILGHEVAAAAQAGAFVLVLGGDCSIVLGSLLGLRSAGRRPLGLAYVDAHADYGTPEESRTGSAASMCLALATGRGESPLARLAGDEPLASPADVVLIGRRDHAEPWYGHAALEASAILDLPHATVRERGPRDSARRALDRLTGRGLLRAKPGARSVAGFWIHLDADVLDPTVMSAVDSPEPGGLDFEELEELLRPLVRRPEALGLELTIYDPTLDPRGVCGERLVALLERLLVGD